MIWKVARYSALVLVVAIVFGILFRDRISTWFEGDKALAANGTKQEDMGKGMSNMPATKKPGPPGERKIAYYYDSMNPTFRSPKPGTATDGMPLVPRYADEVAATANMPVGTVKISEGKQQLIGVTTATVQREPLFRTIRAVAQLTADETKLAHVHLKVTGWIDKVYVDYIGQLVKKEIGRAHV